MEANKSFEAKLKDLQSLVNKLEGGDVPLDQAVSEFKKGISLSGKMTNELKQAKHTMAKVVNSKNDEVPYSRDKDGHDVDDSVKSPREKQGSLHLS